MTDAAGPPGPTARVRTVRLSIPTDPNYVRAARLVAVGIAVPAGFSVDDTEDLAIAVDELSATLLEAARPDGYVDLELTVRDGHIEVHGHAEVAGHLTVDRDRRQLGHEILDAVTAEHDLHLDGDILRFRIVCRRRGPRAELN